MFVWFFGPLSKESLERGSNIPEELGRALGVVFCAAFLVGPLLTSLLLGHHSNQNGPSSAGSQ